MTAALSDTEIAAICSPLVQGAAQIRYIRDVLKIPVQRKPDGKPLVKRCDWEASNQRSANGPRWSKAA